MILNRRKWRFFLFSAFLLKSGEWWQKLKVFKVIIALFICFL